MGFYDCQCMVTGVSLKGAATSLVLLQQTDDRFMPVSLPIKGQYNRLGSIDMIREDVGTQALLDFVHLEDQRGGFTRDREYLRDQNCYPFESLEDVLGAVERSMNDGGQVNIDGKPVAFALIAQVVWNAITQAAAPV